MKHLFLSAALLFSAFCANAQNLTVESQYPGDRRAEGAYQTAVAKQSNEKTSATRATWLANRPGANWFISLEGGLNHLLSEGYNDYPFEKNLQPTGGLALGKWFSPVWGLRLSISGGPLLGYEAPVNNLNGGYAWYIHEGNSHYTNAGEAIEYIPVEIQGDHVYQKLSYANATIDFMVNLKNLFRPYNPKGFFNPVLYAGAGWARTFGSDLDPLGTYKDISKKVAPVDNMVAKGGLQLNFRLCDAWDLYLAAEGLLAPESFDRVLGGNYTYDGVASAKLGFTYHINFRHFIKAPLYDQNEIDALNAEINRLRNARPAEVVCPPVKECPPCPKEQAVVAEVPSAALEPVFFLIDSYVVRENQIVNVAKAAEYLISHPEKKLELASYADKKTGSSAYNLQLSKKRSDAVAKVLTSKFGIDKKRLILKSYGDKEQPYSQNDLNRVTLFIK